MCARAKGDCAFGGDVFAVRSERTQSELCSHVCYAAAKVCTGTGFVVFVFWCRFGNGSRQGFRAIPEMMAEFGGAQDEPAGDRSARPAHRAGWCLFVYTDRRDNVNSLRSIVAVFIELNGHTLCILIHHHRPLLSPEGNGQLFPKGA